MSKDPFLAREAQTYEHPVPSREFIIEYMEKQAKPISRDALFKIFSLSSEEEAEGLRRRLKAMERDGQLVWCRNATYALPEKLNLVKGRVIGHKDGFGFLKRKELGRRANKERCITHRSTDICWQATLIGRNTLMTQTLNP